MVEWGNADLQAMYINLDLDPLNRQSLSNSAECICEIYLFIFHNIMSWSKLPFKDHSSSMYER